MIYLICTFATVQLRICEQYFNVVNSIRVPSQKKLKGIIFVTLSAFNIPDINQKTE